MAEAIVMAEELAGRPLQQRYDDAPRLGDHIGWISDARKFRQMYPEWSFRYDMRAIMSDICAGLTERLAGRAS